MEAQPMTKIEDQVPQAFGGPTTQAQDPLPVAEIQ